MACVNPNTPEFKAALEQAGGNPLIAEIDMEEGLAEEGPSEELLLYLSRQLNDKFGVKIGPEVPDMLELISSQPIINQEDIDNKKLEC